MARKLVGWLQVLGACWSVVVAVGLLYRAQVFTHDPAFALLVLGIITLVGAAGVELLRDRELGKVLTWIAQLIQLVQVTVGEFALRVVVGPQLTIFYSAKSPLHVYAGITMSLNLLRNEQDPSFAIGLNVVALGALLLLITMSPTSQKKGDSGGTKPKAGARSEQVDRTQ